MRATYRAQDLRAGFSVDYASVDGTEWTHNVSPEEAEFELLLTLQPGDTSPATPPPTEMRIKFAESGDGWRLTNVDNYRWRSCVASIGPSEVAVGPIEGGGEIVLDRGRFRPALPADLPRNAFIYVTCKVGSQAFTVSGRASEVPVALNVLPPRLEVRIERNPFGWRIDNATDFTWDQCSAGAGASGASFGPLPGNGAVFVTPSQFMPPLDDLTAVLSVACVDRGTSYVATVLAAPEKQPSLTAPASQAQQGPPPVQLVLKIDRSGDGWRIANEASGYTWEKCIAEIDASSAPLTPLVPNAVVVLRPADFIPIPDMARRPNLFVTCTVGTNLFTATFRN